MAGVGSRFLALAYDTLLQGILLLCEFIVLMLLTGFGMAAMPGQFTIWIWAIAILLFFLIVYGYFGFFEAIWHGQTPGKRRFHLRVIKEDGRPVAPLDAITRNLLRILDSLPGFYMVGILSVLLSSRNKRLGDYVAGTVVVHESPLERTVAGQPASVSGIPQPSGYDVSRLSADEFRMMDAFLIRRAELSSEVRARIARQILEGLGAKLGISPEDRRNRETLLELLASEYRRSKY